jgi:hypothetical protein
LVHHDGAPFHDDDQSAVVGGFVEGWEMDFTGAQTLMGTFKTFVVYAGAVICFGGMAIYRELNWSGRF